MPRSFNMMFGQQPQHVVGAAVTPLLAHNLGVNPAIGQWFVDDNAVLISSDLWKLASFSNRRPAYWRMAWNRASGVSKGPRDADILRTSNERLAILLGNSWHDSWIDTPRIRSRSEAILRNIVWGG